MHKSLLSAAALALAVVAPLAHAHTEGDIIVRAGAITVNPKADSSSVKVDQGPLAGADLRVAAHGRQPLQNRAFWVLVFVRMAQIHLHAVAGGQYGQLRRGLVRLCVVGVVQAVLQLRQRVVQLGRRKRDPLAQGQRSGGVI